MTGETKVDEYARKLSFHLKIIYILIFINFSCCGCFFYYWIAHFHNVCRQTSCDCEKQFVEQSIKSADLLMPIELGDEEDTQSDYGVYVRRVERSPQPLDEFGEKV